MANTLFLRLEGPMQSWGERGKWIERDSAPEPTKSGVVGLLACALGLNGDADLRQLCDQIRLGVRCDRPGTRIEDYHTVFGGVLSAEGKIKITASTGEIETVVSRRVYFCDASFLAAVQASPALIARLAEGLQQPKWPIYLGRRSCPPSRPPFDGLGDYASLEAALESHDPKATSGRVRAVIECAPGEGVRRRDAIISRSRRVFGPRYTREVPITPGTREEEG